MPIPLSDAEKAQIVRGIRNGVGLNRTLRSVGIGQTRYERERDADPDFCRDLEVAKTETMEQLFSIRFEQATKDRDPRAIDFLMNHMAAGERFGREMAEKRQTREMLAKVASDAREPIPPAVASEMMRVGMEMTGAKVDDPTN